MSNTYDLAAYEARCREVNAAGNYVMIAVICPEHLKPMMNLSGGWKELSCGCIEESTVEELRESAGVNRWVQQDNLVATE